MLPSPFLKVSFLILVKNSSSSQIPLLVPSNSYSTVHIYYSIGVVATTDVAEACKDVNIAVMIGGFPRKVGMERKDVMSKNVSIYKAQASALEKHAAADCKVRKTFDLPA